MARTLLLAEDDKLCPKPYQTTMNEGMGGDPGIQRREALTPLPGGRI